MVPQYSKYDWSEAHYISDRNIESILGQLENSNLFFLTDEEFRIPARPGDINTVVGYYKDTITNTHHYKVSNDTRRAIIKAIRIKMIIEQDSEKCVNCGSIDCSTCMQLHKGHDNRLGYIVICHNCNHKSSYY